MKYLHFTEEFVLYELPYARGMQYEAAIHYMEGRDFYFISTPEEMKEANAMLLDILEQDTTEDYEHYE